MMHRSTRRRRCAVVAACAGLFRAGYLPAQMLSFVPGNGNGWNLTQSDWTNGSQSVPWTNGDQATFGPVLPYNQIAVQDAVSASGLTFNQSGAVSLYSQSVNGSSPAITLTGTNPTISLLQSQVSINAPLNGSAGVTIQDGGSGDSVSFSGINSYTGVTNIASGQLTAASLSALGSSNLLVGSAGTLDVTSNLNFNGSTIGLTGAMYVEPGVTFNCSNITTVNQTAGLLDVMGQFTLGAGTFNYSGGTIQGDVSLTTDASLNLGPSVHSGTFVFTSKVFAQYLTTTSSPFAIPAGVTIDVAPIAGSGNLDLLASVNNGTIALIAPPGGTARLTAEFSVLTNSGTIVASAAGPSSSSDLIIVSVLNNSAGATVFINAGTSLSGITNNFGNFTIAAGASLGLSNSTDVFNQAGGLLTVNGTFPINVGTFVFTGGSIVSGPVILGQNGSLQLGANAGSGVFEVSNPLNLTLQAPAYAVPAGVTIADLPGSSGALNINSSVTNYGTLSLLGSGSVSAALSAGAFNNDGILSVGAGGFGGGTAKVSIGSFNNMAGALVNLDTSIINLAGATTTNYGTFNVATGAQVNLTNSSPTFNQANGSLVLNGLLLMNSGTFDFAGGNITGNPAALNGSTGLILGTNTGSGAFNFAGGSHTLTVSSPGSIIPAGVAIHISDAVFLQSGGVSILNNGILQLIAAGSVQPELAGYGVTLTNNGFLGISASGAYSATPTLAVQSLNNSAGATIAVNIPSQVTGTSTLNNFGNLNIASGASLTCSTSGGIGINQAGGTLFIGGSLFVTAGQFVFSGGNISGNPVVLSNTGGLRLGAGAGQGLFEFVGPQAGGGDYPLSFTTSSNTIPAGVTINMLTPYEALALTVTGGLTNNGTITFTSFLNGAPGMSISNGPLVNAGTIDLGPTLSPSYQGEISVSMWNNTTGGIVAMDSPTIFTGSTLINSGTFTIAAGAFLNFSAASATLNQLGGTFTALGAISSNATLNWTGGTIILGGPTPAFGGAPPVPPGGTLVLQPSVTNPSISLIVNGNGTVNLLANVNSSSGILTRYLPGVSFNGSGGQVNVQATAVQGSRQFIFTNALSIPYAGPVLQGQVDLANNDMDVYQGNLQLISDYIASGYAGGAWNGPGIASSAAAADTSHLTALGVIQDTAGLYGINGSLGAFDGFYPRAGDVLIKYTYYGDTNLDGKLDGSDFSRIDNGFLSNGSLTGWFNGDFNYDGAIDGSDYTLVDNAYNRQGAAITAQAVPTAQTDVPEPASLSLMLITAAGLTVRRRQP